MTIVIRSKPTRRSQQGAVAIFVVIILLSIAAMVSLFTTKAILLEQKTSANAYRYEQAFAAAKAAWDEGFAYYGESFTLDTTNETTAQATSGDVHTNTIFPVASADLDGDGTPDLTVCAQWSIFKVANGDPSDPTVEIRASGYSDDYNQDGSCGPGTFTGYAEHNIFHQAEPVNVTGGGPRQPMIVRGTSGLTGNMEVINAYFNSTIWSGSSVDIGNSASAATYVDNPNEGTDPSSVTLDNYDDNTLDLTLIASERQLGVNFDIIEDDVELSSLTEPEFFENFIQVSKDRFESIARNNDTPVAHWYDGQTTAQNYFNGLSDPITGYVWIEGDYTLNGGTIGEVGGPVIFVVNGNFESKGNPDIYGLLYVAGDWEISAGTTDIIGTAIIAGQQFGTGTTRVIFNPDALVNLSPGGIPPLVRPYTWRDWE